MSTQKKKDISESQQNLLRQLPGVDAVLEMIHQKGLFADIPKRVVTQAVRDVIGHFRKAILSQPDQVSHCLISEEAILEKVHAMVESAMALNLDRLINATGVVVHTNLGRSLLSGEALSQVQTVASRYSNLEFDLSTGKRGSRYSVVEDLICEISGAESAMVVNNNAAAVLLSLDTIAREKEVIVSRGELVEIGGSFRIPDVMSKSGAVLKEVGTTNRTHVSDYQNAISDETGLLLKVHTSNFSIVGFTRAVSLPELAELGAEHHLPVMEDLGSGTFIDFSKYGLMKEPTVQESLAAGIDIVTFSGDKLLGGPQAGLIVGKKPIIDRIKKNPLTRALRIDKLTLAGLESTLRAYRDESRAIQNIPTLQMITAAISDIEEKAGKLKSMLESKTENRIHPEIIAASSRAGGGSLPLLELPSKCVAIRAPGLSAKALGTRLRQHKPPVIVRIEDDRILMDMRTVQNDELETIATAITQILNEAGHDPSN
ncbi:MAG TPA: L-seryl-tRNA(Sec) selenium transferase [Desulfosalsimonadaceae bacterium]|nr:L-seryl-tRNA(Sec) selenium transferase [Desulfosalsimonadaceae bacterium]